MRKAGSFLLMALVAALLIGFSTSAQAFHHGRCMKCVCVPACVEQEVECTVFVPKWEEKEVTYTVCERQVEERQGIRKVCVPTKEKKTIEVCVDKGHWETTEVPVTCCFKRCCHKHFCKRHCCAYSCGCGCACGCGVAVQKVCKVQKWIPDIQKVKKEIVVCGTQLIDKPYKYNVVTFKPVKKTTKVKCCKMVPEVRNIKVCKPCATPCCFKKHCKHSCAPCCAAPAVVAPVKDCATCGTAAPAQELKVETKAAAKAAPAPKAAPAAPVKK